MRKNYSIPEIKIRAFGEAVHLTNSENVNNQASQQYTNVQMTKVKINWQEK